MPTEIQNILIMVKGVFDLFGLTPYITTFAVILMVGAFMANMSHKS